MYKFIFINYYLFLEGQPIESVELSTTLDGLNSYAIEDVISGNKLREIVDANNDIIKIKKATMMTQDKPVERQFTGRTTAFRNIK